MNKKLMITLICSVVFGWFIWYGLSVYQNNRKVVFDTQSISNIFNCGATSVRNNIIYGDCIWLISLYYSTNGYNWTNNINHNNEWLVWSDPCSRYGVTCEHRRVVKLDLNSNNLMFEINPSIRLMASLRYLNLNNNRLCKIPENIVYLNNLIDNVWLDISYNNLDPNQYSDTFIDWMQSKWYSFGTQNSQGCNMNNANNNNSSNGSTSSSSSNGWPNNNTTTINTNWNNNPSNWNNTTTTNPNNPSAGTNTSSNASCDNYCYFWWVNQYHKFNCANISTITIPWVSAVLANGYNRSLDTDQNTTIDHGNRMEWMFTLPAPWTYNFTVSYNNNVLCSKTIIY